LPFAVYETPHSPDHADRTLGFGLFDMFLFVLVVGGNIFAVVADNLEATDHLTDGEETKALGRHDTGGDNLGAAQVLNS